MYDKIRYLVLFRPKNMMPFTTGLDTLLVKKSGITYVIYCNYASAKVDSYDSSPLEKTLTSNNVILLIKDSF